MKRQGSSRMTVVLTGVIVGIVVAGGEPMKADFAFYEPSWLVGKARNRGGTYYA